MSRYRSYHPVLGVGVALSLQLVVGGCGELLGFSAEYTRVGAGEGGAPDGSGTGGASGGTLSPSGGAASGGAASGGSKPESLEDFELPEGRLVYHRFTSYATGDSEMFVVELPSGQIRQEVGDAYDLCNPMHGSLSPDGKWLAVTATSPRVDPCPATDRNPLEIYLLDLEQPGTKIRATNNVDVPDEDPQFSADGEFIVFKRGGHLAEWQLGSAPFGSCAPGQVTAGSTCYNGSEGEQSKPVITADGSQICYQELQDWMADIFCVDRAQARTGTLLSTIRTPVTQRSYVYEAWPVIIGDHLYFQRWRSNQNTKKFIARKKFGDFSSLEEVPRFGRDEGSSYRDPTSLGSDYLLFSTDVNGAGPTDLFIGRFGAEELLSLDAWIPRINSAKYEYGASFQPAPP